MHKEQALPSRLLNTNQVSDIMNLTEVADNLCPSQNVIDDNENSMGKKLKRNYVGTEKPRVFCH